MVFFAERKPARLRTLFPIRRIIPAGAINSIVRHIFCGPLPKQRLYWLHIGSNNTAMSRTSDIGEAIASGLSNTEASGPIYRRVARAIADLIAQRTLTGNTALPPERDLAELLGLGRVTVRNAYKELIAEGLVEQRRGSGTFVTDQSARISQSLWRLTSFSEDMLSRGMQPGARILGRSAGNPSPREAFGLGIGMQTHVFRLHRLRLADGKPMAIERAVVPLSFVGGAEPVESSLYEALARHGHRPVKALQRLTAVTADAENGTLLGLTPGAPALLIERVSRLADDRIVEYTRSLYRGDAYDFVAELRYGDRP